MKKKMNKNLTVGLWLTGIMLTLILVGFFWTPYNPETMDNAAKLSGVSFSHLMGCDNFGRDIFSRVLKRRRHDVLRGAWHSSDRHGIWCYHRGVYRIFRWNFG